jgi:SMI1 / KNR4 family (SUKH-1)
MVMEMSSIEDAYRKFAIDRFPLPSEDQLAQLEARIDVVFPEDYRQFILRFNGGYFKKPEIEPVGEECPLEVLAFLHGIGASHWEAELASDFYLALFDDNNPPLFVPIGSTGSGGLILIVTEAEGHGEIFLKQAFGDFHYLAEDIEEFFALLREPTRD